MSEMPCEYIPSLAMRVCFDTFLGLYCPCQDDPKLARITNLGPILDRGEEE